MSNVGKFKDPIPRVPPAGKQTTIESENADNCIRQDVHYQPPSTPEHVIKYRKSFNNRPGVKQVHPGLYDFKPDPSKKYGKPTYTSDHVQDVLLAQNLSGLAQFNNDIKEKIYASGKMEPLGRSMLRGHQLPEVTKTENFAFGIPSKSEISTKDLLYPHHGHFEERVPHAAQYKKTHGNFEPGEQKQRDYNWGAIDVKSQKFGKYEAKLLNGAAQAAHAERFEGEFPKTTIVQKTVEDHKAVAHEHLGKSKNLGTGAHVQDGRTFGMPSVKVGSLSWNAAKCIHGEPTEQELKRDDDLGRCTKVGCRNVLRREEDQDRAFGCPTIRTDIPFKEKRSMADPNNYGDQKQTNELLYPRGYWELGITEDDFQLLRGREELRDIFEKIGFKYKVGKFNTMFNRACTIVSH